MSQHDFTIANQSASNARTDINNALQALASTSSGGSAPSNPYAGQLWFDTVVTINSNYSILKIRNKNNSSWISLLYVDNSTNEIKYFSNREVINTSDAVRGTLDRQNNADWTTGTSDVYSLVSPAQVKAAIDSLTIGQDQTWNDVSSIRSLGVSYQNTSGRPIEVAAQWNRGPSVWRAYLYVSSDGSNWLQRGFSYHGSVEDETNVLSTIVPPNSYYRIGSNSDGTGSSNGTSLMFWLELI